MFPDPAEPVFCITDSPSSMTGTRKLVPLILESDKHVALFFIGDLVLHEAHPLFLRFASMCKLYGHLRPIILARTSRIGGMRKPDWSDDDILFLATNSTRTKKTYGLNGKNDLGLIIIRPDGYVGYSMTIDESGNAFQSAEAWLELNLLKA